MTREQEFLAKGYCQATAEASAHLDTSTERIHWLEAHVLTCETCEFANRMMDVQARCAESLGPKAIAKFQAGQDFTLEIPVQMFAQELQRCIQAIGPVRRERFMAWLASTVAAARHHHQEDL